VMMRVSVMRKLWQPATGNGKRRRAEKQNALKA